MAISTRTIGNLPDSQMSLQNGDWFVIDRAGTPNKITWQNVLAGALNSSNTAVLGNTTISDPAPRLTFIDTDIANLFSTISIDNSGTIRLRADVDNVAGASRVTFEVDGTQQAEITGTGLALTTDLAIAHGGTGASTAADARTNLGLGTIATQAANSVAITGGSITGTPIGAGTPASAVFTTADINGQRFAVNHPSAPYVEWHETSGPSTNRVTRAFGFNGGWELQTLTSAGALVSTDYVISKGASGATEHSFRCAGAETLSMTNGNFEVRHSGATRFAVNSLGIQMSSSLDNTQDIGGPLGRYDDVWATNGTIQTSDEREKQDIAELTDAERRVAVRLKSLVRTFRWKSAVETKGDDARIHCGMIAQDVASAFEAEGLDPYRYALLIGTPDDVRMGVRYPELLAFIIAAMG